MNRSQEASIIPNKGKCKYRNLKHETINRKMLLNALLYYNYYLQPILIPYTQTLSHFLEFGGFLLLILSLPLLILLVIVSFISRNIRLFLIRKYAAKNKTIINTNAFRTTRDSVITFVVWLDGFINIKELLSNAEKVDSLKMNLQEMYGVLYWSLSKTGPDKNICILKPEHIKFKCSGAGFYGFKAGTEQFISNYLKISNEIQPNCWKITIIPQKVDSKQNACCILQFHSRLLEKLEVVNFLQNLVGQSSTISVESEAKVLEFSALHGSAEKDIVELFTCLKVYGSCLKKSFNEWILKGVEYYKTAKASLKLMVQQYNFHSRKVFIKLLLYSIINNLVTMLNTSVLYLRTLPILEYLQSTKYSVLLFLRAISYMPYIFVQMHIWKSNPLICRTKKTSKINSERRKYFEASWSQPVSNSFLEMISAKGQDISIESLILTTCAMGIKEYLLNWSIPNPRHVKVILQNTNEFKVIRISTNEFDISSELERIETRIKNYPLWKEFGLYYFEKVAECLLPFWLLRKMDINRIAPITFRYIDLDTPNAPIELSCLSLFGCPVEDIWTFSTPIIPKEIHGRISITGIKYRGSTRLSIFSGIESLDIALSKMFPRYLNKLAEVLGVEKTQIPYSQKSSPCSTSCTSPSTF